MTVARSLWLQLKRVYIFINWYLFVCLAGALVRWSKRKCRHFRCQCKMPIELFVDQMEHFSRQCGVSDLCNGSADVQFFFLFFSVMSWTRNSNLYADAHFWASIGAKIRKFTSSIEPNSTEWLKKNRSISTRMTQWGRLVSKWHPIYLQQQRDN